MKRHLLTPATAVWAGTVAAILAFVIPFTYNLGADSARSAPRVASRNPPAKIRAPSITGRTEKPREQSEADSTSTESVKPAEQAPNGTPPTSSGGAVPAAQKPAPAPVMPSEEVEQPVETTRPANGEVIGRTQELSGPCKFTVENGGGVDAVVVLAEGGSKRVFTAFYVRARNTYTLDGVRLGDYRVFFRAGKRWAPSRGRFLESHGISRFVDPLEFSEPMEWQVSLQPVLNGTAKTASIREDDFPTIGS